MLCKKEKHKLCGMTGLVRWLVVGKCFLSYITINTVCYFCFSRANVLKSKGVTHIDIQQLQNFENGIFNKSSGPVRRCKISNWLMLC